MIYTNLMYFHFYLFSIVQYEKEKKEMISVNSVVIILIISSETINKFPYLPLFRILNLSFNTCILKQ